MLSAEKQLEILRQGAKEIIPSEELERKLGNSRETGRPLIVKQGFDPTAPELHVGHAVCIRKLLDFQRLGHEVVFLIGDFTALIGDPSGRSETRVRLSPEEIAANAETYRKQVFKLLDPDRTRIEFNSRWCTPMRFSEILDLARRYTVARMLERDDFKKRFETQQPISMLEFLYPLVQAYDSVALRADVEIGGTDQTFNMLVARDIQREYGQEPQVILTMPILPGTDGVDKMSKSLGNHIGIDESPETIFGKTMSIPDAVLPEYVTLVGDWSVAQTKKRLAALEKGSVNPSHVKRELARDLVRQFHGPEAAVSAESAFDRVFVRKGVPDEIPGFEVEGSSVELVQVLVQAGLAPSRSEARRLVRQGAVQLDGARIHDERAVLRSADVRSGVLKVGKRRFVQLEFREKSSGRTKPSGSGRRTTP